MAVAVNDLDGIVKTWSNYGYIVTKPYKVDNSTIEYTFWNGSENVTVQEEYSDVPQGQVISQSIDPGKTVNKGTDITIVVSKGPETKTYACNYSVPLNGPKGAVSSTIKLVDSNGKTLATQSAAATGSYQLSVGNIQGTSTGTIYITYNIEEDVLDADGNPTGEKKTSTSDGGSISVNFTQQ